MSQQYTLLSTKPLNIYNNAKLNTSTTDQLRIKSLSTLKSQKSPFLINAKNNPTINRCYSRDNQQKSSIKNTTNQILPLLSISFGIYLINAAEPVSALSLLFKTEVSNELSFPTWLIHISSVLEWMTAMWLIWQYAEVSGNSKWKGMTWGMFPCLISALCACTWHYFYNAPELEAFMTVVGNVTCWIAAYRLYKSSVTN